VARTANSEQQARAKARAARLERARTRRVALDKGRVERDGRIDAAVADVFQAQDERQAALACVADADRRIGQAIARLADEGVTTAQVAELCELTVTAVQRLKTVTAGGPKGQPETTGRSMARSTPNAPTGPAA
jgi:hypothetical protein